MIEIEFLPHILQIYYVYTSVYLHAKQNSVCRREAYTYTSLWGPVNFCWVSFEGGVSYLAAVLMNNDSGFCACSLELWGMTMPVFTIAHRHRLLPSSGVEYECTRASSIGDASVFPRWQLSPSPLSIQLSLSRPANS
jgi:hypothetical protein